MAVKMCVLDETKVCDNCGECIRCDLDPNKICDNCCRCIAMEDEGKEFRSITFSGDGVILKKPSKGSVSAAKKGTEPEYASVKPVSDTGTDEGPCDEPTELTPELVEYWEKKLIEYGEAPADDGFGEIEVSLRNPVYGKRRKAERRLPNDHRH